MSSYNDSQSCLGYGQFCQQNRFKIFGQRWSVPKLANKLLQDNSCFFNLPSMVCSILLHVAFNFVQLIMGTYVYVPIH